MDIDAFLDEETEILNELNDQENPSLDVRSVGVKRKRTPSPSRPSSIYEKIKREALDLVDSLQFDTEIDQIFNMEARVDGEAETGRCNRSFLDTSILNNDTTSLSETCRSTVHIESSHDQLNTSNDVDMMTRDEYEHMNHRVNKQQPEVRLLEQVPIGRNFLPVTLLDGRTGYVVLEEDDGQVMLHSTHWTSLAAGNDDDGSVLGQDNDTRYFDTTRPIDDGRHWVDVYRPQKFFDLLSDATVNRQLLTWIKSWDWTVFKAGNRNQAPQTPLAALHGPPGLGKTTLVNILGRHAGYRIHEVNASDDRNIDAMRGMFDSLKFRFVSTAQPVLVLLDEFDGAPEATVRFVLSLACNKPRNPMICVCNDWYANSMRPMRQSKDVKMFSLQPSPTHDRTADRLCEIWRREHRNQPEPEDLKPACMILCNRTGGDIRNCIHALQVISIGSTSTMMMERAKAVCEKDRPTGMFDAWRAVFSSAYSSEEVEQMWSNVSSDETDIRMAGLFENQITYAGRGSGLDKLNRLFCVLQDWQDFDSHLFGGPFARLIVPLAIHLSCTSSVSRCLRVERLVFPRTLITELRLAEIQSIDVVGSMKKRADYKDGQFSPVPSTDKRALVLESVPYVSPIVCYPNLRAIDPQLYRPQENYILDLVVNVMTFYCLSFKEEVQNESIISQKLQPNLETLTHFSISGSVPAAGNSSIRKFIQSRLVEFLLKRSYMSVRKGTQIEQTSKGKARHGDQKRTDRVATDLQKAVKRISLADYIVKSKSDVLEAEKKIGGRHEIVFKHSSGYSRAVRRKVYIKDFLQ